MNAASGRASVHLVVGGRVQGVGFRYFVEREARRLGLDGWVRNLSSGEVEIEAAGERGTLESLLASVRRGPGGCRVEAVEVQWTDDAGGHQGFHIRF